MKHVLTPAVFNKFDKTVTGAWCNMTVPAHLCYSLVPLLMRLCFCMLIVRPRLQSLSSNARVTYPGRIVFTCTFSGNPTPSIVVTAPSFDSNSLPARATIVPTSGKKLISFCWVTAECPIVLPLKFWSTSAVDDTHMLGSCMVQTASGTKD